MKYILFFIPAIINLLMTIFFHFSNIGGIGSYQTILNVYVAPFYLLIISIYFMKKSLFKQHLCIVFSDIVLISNAVISYCYWGIETGKLFSPDTETVMFVLYLDTLFPIVALNIVFISYMLFKRFMK